MDRRRRHRGPQIRPPPALQLGAAVISFDGFRVRQTPGRTHELRVEKGEESWGLDTMALVAAPSRAAALIDASWGARVFETRAKVLSDGDKEGASAPIALAIVLRDAEGRVTGAAIVRDVAGRDAADGPDSSLVVGYQCGDLPPLLAGLVGLGRALAKAAVVLLSRNAPPGWTSAGPVAVARRYRGVANGDGQRPAAVTIFERFTGETKENPHRCI